MNHPAEVWPIPHSEQCGRVPYPGPAGAAAERAYVRYRELKRSGRAVEAGQAARGLVGLGFMLDNSEPLGYRPIRAASNATPGALPDSGSRGMMAPPEPARVAPGGFPDSAGRGGGVSVTDASDSCPAAEDRTRAVT